MSFTVSSATSSECSAAIPRTQVAGATIGELGRPCWPPAFRGSVFLSDGTWWEQGGDAAPHGVLQKWMEEHNFRSTFYTEASINLARLGRG